MTIDELVASVRRYPQKLTCMSKRKNDLRGSDFIFVDLDESEEPIDVPDGYKELLPNDEIIRILDGLKSLEQRDSDDVERFLQYLSNDA